MTKSEDWAVRRLNEWVRDQQELEERSKRIKECASRDHPYNKKYFYNPARDILFEGCTYCGFVNERQPTSQERESYLKTFPLYTGKVAVA